MGSETYFQTYAARWPTAPVEPPWSSWRRGLLGFLFMPGWLPPTTVTARPYRYHSRWSGHVYNLEDLGYNIQSPGY
jgi:hypothetical protein